EEGRVVLPAAGDLRRQRGGGPGVHDVRVTGEATGLATLGRLVAVRDVGGRIDGESGLLRHDGRAVVRLAVAADRVPDRHGHAEVPLATDQPVAVEPVDPVVE